MQSANNIKTFVFTIDFTQTSNNDAPDFVNKIIEEFESKGARLLRQEGINFSYQNPQAFLHHLRFFHDPVIKSAIANIKNKVRWSYDDHDICNFIYQIFNSAAWSPLLTRMYSGEAVEPYEFTTYRDSFIFYTSFHHPGDPRIFTD